MEDATSFVAEIEAVVDNRLEAKTDVLAAKKDIIDLRFEMKKELADLRVEMKEQKTDLMKAIYLTGLIQFLAIMSSVIGIVMLFLKK